MEDTALILLGVFGAIAIGGRVAIQLRTTGETGVKPISGEFGSREWLAGVLFVLAIVLAVAGPLLDAMDVSEPVGALEGEPGQAAGIGLYAGGLLTTVVSQLAMGASWRIGVDPGERTKLVTSGPFSVVRNPIYSGMIPAWIGLALLCPTPLSLASVATLIAALEMQTRLVEEPYLLRTHGDAYASYAARVGRFLPGVGRLRRL